MTVIRLIARPMLASMFVVGGIDSLTHAFDTLAEAWVPSSPSADSPTRSTKPSAPTTTFMPTGVPNCTAA